VGYEPGDWDEPPDTRPIFRVGRVAFGMLAAAVALSSATYMLHVVAIFTGSWNLIQFLESPIWEWVIGATSTFLAFFGAMLLMGRGRDREWQMRAILATLLYGYFLTYWFLDHAKAMGFNGFPEPDRRDDIRFLAGRILGLVAILSVGSLANDEASRLGCREAPGLFRAVRGAFGVGLMLWVLYSFRRIDWEHPWPPRFLPIRDLETLLIYLGLLLARGMAGAFAVVLCGHACAYCSRELARVEIAIRDGDPFRSRSENGA